MATPRNKPTRGRATAPSSVPWATPKPLSRRNVHMDIWGDSGTGRSHLAATAPTPAGVIDLDYNFDRVVGNFDPKNYRTVPIRYSAKETIDRTKETCVVAWRMVEAAALDCGSWSRTCIIDTATEAWELVRLADHGTPTPQGKRMDRLWGGTNAHFRKVLRAWREPGINLITISQAADEYKDDKKGESKRTGRRVRQGFSKLEYLIDVGVRTFIDEDGEFSAEITTNKFNIDLHGIVVVGEDLNFAAIMGMCTGTDPEEWV